MLHNFCEIQNEKLADDSISKAKQRERSEQPPIRNRYSLGSNDEASGKKIRTYFLNILTDFIMFVNLNL